MNYYYILCEVALVEEDVTIPNSIVNWTYSISIRSRRPCHRCISLGLCGVPWSQPGAFSTIRGYCKRTVLDESAMREQDLQS